MSKIPDNNLEQALTLAKSHILEDVLTVHNLFTAMIHSDGYVKSYSFLAKEFPLPPAVDPAKEKVRPSIPLKKIIKESYEEDHIVGDTVFEKLLFHHSIFDTASEKQKRVLKESQQLYLLRTYQSSEEHTELMQRLGRFGRLIGKEGTSSTLCGREVLFPKMSRALMKMLGNDVLLIGPKGIGKSKIIQEFARRIDACDPAIPRNLHGAEVFQLSAELLRSGVISRPEFQKRVRILKGLLSEHPKIILVLNPIDALINTDARRTDQQLAEEAIRELIESNLPVIATVNPQSYLLLDGKKEWKSIFTRCTVQEPTKEGLIEILEDLTEMFEEHYLGLEIEKSALSLIPDLAKESNPNQCDPRRSVQFLDDLCVRAQTNTPPYALLNEANIRTLLELDQESNTTFVATNLECLPNSAHSASL